VSVTAHDILLFYKQKASMTGRHPSTTISHSHAGCCSTCCRLTGLEMQTRMQRVFDCPKVKQQTAQQQAKVHWKVASSTPAGSTQLLAEHWWRDTQLLAANLKLPVSVVQQLDEEELQDLQQLHACLKQHHLDEHLMPVLRCCTDGKQLAERITLVDSFVGYIGPQCSHGDARAAWDEAMQLLWDMQQLHSYGRAGPYLPFVDMLLLAESPVQLRSQLQHVQALLLRLPAPNAALAAAQAPATAAKVAAVERMRAAAAAAEAAAIRTAAMAAAGAAAAARTAAAWPAVDAAFWLAAVPEAAATNADVMSAALAADLAEELALYALPQQQQQQQQQLPRIPVEPASVAYSYSLYCSSSSSMPAWQGSPTAPVPAAEAVAAAATSRAASSDSASANVAPAAAGSMAAVAMDTTTEEPSYRREPALPADDQLCMNDGLAGSSGSGDFLSVTPQQRQSVPMGADSAAAAASASISGGEVQVVDTVSDSGADGGKVTAMSSSSSIGESVVFGEALVSGEPLVFGEPGRLSYDGPGTPAAVSVAASCAASPRPSYDGAGDDSSSSSGGDAQPVIGGSKQQQRVACKGGVLRGVAGCMPVRLLLKGLTRTALLCRPRFG
jgi:hypothetical protein